MPNTGHYTICPYFMSERSKAITCEDVFRRFKSKKEKDEWMHTFCDKDWKKCKYAQSLHAMHERINEKGEKDRMIEIFKHKSQATREELKKVSTQLGKTEAKKEKQEDLIRYLKAREESTVKKIADLQAENNALMENIETLREKNKELFKKWQDERKTVFDKEEKMLAEMLEQANIFEGYIAYLLHTHGEEFLDVEGAFDWADKYEYAISAGEYSEDKKLKSLKLTVREIEDGDNGSAGEIPETGSGEDGKREKEDPGAETDQQ